MENRKLQEDNARMVEEIVIGEESLFTEKSRSEKLKIEIAELEKKLRESEEKAA